MRFLNRLSSNDGHSADLARPRSAREDRHFPFPGYDDLTAARVVDQLHRRSQTELAKIEAYERVHLHRPEVLEELRLLRCEEPLPRYDMLSADEISAALAAADLPTLRVVCAYEMKLSRRVDVLDELSRLRRARASDDVA
jgi:hypothetical protein